MKDPTNRPGTLRLAATAISVAALSLGLVGCGTNKAETSSGGGSSGAVSDTLTMALSFTSNYDPDVFFDLEGTTITSALYEGLIRYAPSGDEIEGVLADSWEVSPDGLTITFTLKPDLTFSDGSPIDAAAVKAAFERKAGVASTPSYILAEVAGYEAPDASTFVITLSQPVNNFLDRLAGPWGSLITNVAELDANAVGDDLGQKYLEDNSAGSGPYVMTEFVPDERIVLDVNENYWGDKPFFKQVVFKVLPDSSAQRLQVEQGDIDIMQGPSPAAATELSSSDAVTVESLPAYALAAFQVNITKAPFDDLAVRQALIKSIPYDDIVADVWGDEWATRSKQMLPKDRMPTDMAVFDPESDSGAFKKATADLDKSEPVLLGYITPDIGNVSARVNDYIGDILTDAGFEVQQVPATSPEYFGYLGAPDVTPNLVFSAQSDDGIHPDNWFRLFLSTTGALSVGGIGLPEADALMDEGNLSPAGAAPDLEKYSEASDLLAEAVHYIPLADVAPRYVFGTDITGLTNHRISPPAIWVADLARK